MKSNENEKYEIVFMPDNIKAFAQKGEKMSDCAIKAGIKIGHSCGGCGTCGKCRVKVDLNSDFLEPVTETEIKILSIDEINSGVRLSCCAVIKGQGIVSVIDRVKDKESKILSGFSDKDIINWQNGKTGFGVAIDIGTTTVVCYLLDLEKHLHIDTFSFLNPQVAFGDDVISRIAFSSSSQNALLDVQTALISKLNEAFSEITERNGIEKNSIVEITIAANTVMEHLFVGVSPSSIGKSPYMPQFFDHPPFLASSIGIDINENALVKLLPNVAGYVGADIVSGVLAYDMDSSPRMRLLIDIGTNNEIVIGNKDGMFCCATAAGPAFEGARIKYGMRASNGAIEKVFMEDDILKCGVIGNVTAVGICGSGLIDAIALLVQEKIIAKSGRMVTNDECTDQRFKSKIDKDEKGMVRILLTNAEYPVYLTQKDVREVQLALGAVRVGIDVMLERVGITKDEVDEVLLAGAFGNNIDVSSAVKVGLLPDVPVSKITCVRNSSGYGACLALASDDFYKRSFDTYKKMAYVELSTLPDFQKRFIAAMTF